MGLQATTALVPKTLKAKTYLGGFDGAVRRYRYATMLLTSLFAHLITYICIYIYIYIYIYIHIRYIYIAH